FPSTPASVLHLPPKLLSGSTAESAVVSSLLLHPVFLYCENDNLPLLKHRFRLLKNTSCNSDCDDQQAPGKTLPYHLPWPFLPGCKAFHTTFHHGAYQWF